MKNEYDNSEEKPSKTSRKKTMQSLQEAGQKLLMLSTTQLSRVPLSKELKKALDEFANLPNSHEAKRRQLQYIGRLMRDFDLHEIESMIQTAMQPPAREPEAAGKTGTIVDRIVEQGDSEIHHLLNQNPQLNRQFLRTNYLAYQRARKTGSQAEMTKYRNLIVQYIDDHL